MKPARFILNSDYVTTRKTGEFSESVTIPNDFYTPSAEPGVDPEYVIAQKTITLPTDTDTFIMYFTSSAFDYAVFGWWTGTKPDGAYVDGLFHETDIYVNVDLLCQGNVVTFKVFCSNPFPSGTAHYVGYGQTITAHILTFKDPFSE